jgi:ankyrin repeat protein
MEDQLLCAAYTGGIDRIKELISQGAAVNTRRQWGSNSKFFSNKHTALTLAAKAGHLAIVRALLEAGASVNRTTCDRWTPLMCATEKCHVDVLRVLLSAGADINYRHKDGYTALYIAVQNNAAKCVQILLEAGADIHVKHKITGDSARMLAVANNNVECVREFLWVKRNSMINLRDHLLNCDD